MIHINNRKRTQKEDGDMPFVFCYTKKGEGIYPQDNYPGLTAYLCDLEHAMHLALSEADESFTPLRNNTGILFPRCTFAEGKPEGTTKTLIDPWLFRMKDGRFGVAAVRRNQNAPDPLSVGCMMRFTSENLVRYEESGFLKLADQDIRRPRCRWDPDRQAYSLEWESAGSRYAGWTEDFLAVKDAHAIEQSSFQSCPDCGVEGAVPGNILEISDAEAETLRRFLGVIENIGVSVPEVSSLRGTPVPFEALPAAVCHYSDGSVHEKGVDWNREAYDRIDFSLPGAYKISGTVHLKHWDVPMHLSPSGVSKEENTEIMRFRNPDFMSDPCISEWRGKYYLSSSGGRSVILRCADRPEEVFRGRPSCIRVFENAPGVDHMETWAPELHEIGGKLYILFGLCPGKWTRVQSYIMGCSGDPMNAADWDEAHPVIKRDGTPLTEGGISLDMTYFCDGGVHYVMWSDRKIPSQEPVVAEPADIYIAAVNPKTPWVLVSDPVCVIRPMYGWDRCQTEVDEGPYLLRRGEDLFVTISGSSTGLADLYDVGLLHARSGTDLLNPANWDWLPYPLLTKESVPNQYGPGHNCFIKDPETGDDLMPLHVVPHDAAGRSLGRVPTVRRVHWASTGLPYLEMTEERDLPERFRKVSLTVTVKA